MLLRPVTFGCCAATILFLLYLGRLCLVDPEEYHFLKPFSSQQDTTAHETATAVSPVASVEINNAEEVYSFEPLVSNSTLGFEKILAINLPSRPDRRDVMTLMADHTNVEIEWVEAVRGQDVNRKAWPNHWNSKLAGPEHANLSMGYLGGWRTHLNCIRKYEILQTRSITTRGSDLNRVVEEGWNTALILEDDADWDVNIKSQMQQFANRTRNLGNSRRDPEKWITGDTPTNNPYGEEWDILWLGPCLNPPGPPDSQRFPGEDAQQAHWVYYAHGYLACTWGYAITQKSARKLLGWLLDVSDAVDKEMSQYCEFNPCIVVWPELVGSYKPAGGNAKGSDNVPDTEQDEVLEKGWTKNVVHSATVEVLVKYSHQGPWLL